MKFKNLFDYVFVEPLDRFELNNLYIVSGYATPNMLSKLIKDLEPRRIQTPPSIHIIAGMTQEDGLSVSAHSGFKNIIKLSPPGTIECSYVYVPPAVHTKLYIWTKDDNPKIAFTGSANFSQSAFSCKRRELMVECDAVNAFEYYKSIEKDSIYCNHPEVEEYITLCSTHAILDEENRLILSEGQAMPEGLEKVTLSLLARDGETGKKSGINWGQRNGRNKSQAYIGQPAEVARSGFFPLEGRHFTVITDDRKQLILRAEQDGDKAITTPHNNALIGEYLRYRLGLPNDAFVHRGDLERYGRTDVTFYKLDEEHFFMDFST